jgi:hypothetical protein
VLDDNVKNLRILEEAMFKLGIRKDLDVAGIAKGKFQVGCAVANDSSSFPGECHESQELSESFRPLAQGS